MRAFRRILRYLHCSYEFICSLKELEMESIDLLTLILLDLIQEKIYYMIHVYCSMTGCCISRKATMVALSTTKAEHMAIT